MTDLSIIESNYSHYIIIGCSIGGILWGSLNAHWVSFVTRAPGLVPLQARRSPPLSLYIDWFWLLTRSFLLTNR